MVASGPAPPCQVEVVDLTTDLMDALERVSGTRPFRVPGMAAGAPAMPRHAARGPDHEQASEPRSVQFLPSNGRPLTL